MLIEKSKTKPTNPKKRSKSAIEQQLEEDEEFWGITVSDLIVHIHNF